MRDISHAILFSRDKGERKYSMQQQFITLEYSQNSYMPCAMTLKNVQPDHNNPSMWTETQTTNCPAVNVDYCILHGGSKEQCYTILVIQHCLLNSCDGNNCAV